MDAVITKSSLRCVGVVSPDTAPTSRVDSQDPLFLPPLRLLPGCDSKDTHPLSHLEFPTLGLLHTWGLTSAGQLVTSCVTGLGETA